MTIITNKNNHLYFFYSNSDFTLPPFIIADIIFFVLVLFQPNFLVDITTDQITASFSKHNLMSINVLNSLLSN